MDCAFKICHDTIMKNNQIIFVHGWGCGPDVWDFVIPQLSEFDCRAIDIGFTSDHDSLDVISQENCVYVTHSLGTMWALKNKPKEMSALITVNGFTCFQRLTDLRSLKRMKLHLKRNPEGQMQEFWQTTDLPHSNQLNVDRLETGLDWLMEWDCSEELAALTCPVHSMFGDNDPILDIQHMKDHWVSHNHHIVKGGKHNLPKTHAKECADLIRGVVDAL